MEMNKFTPSLMTFLRKEFKDKNQYFFTYGEFSEITSYIHDDTYYAGNLKNRFSKIKKIHIPLLLKLYKSEKVFLHGLFDFYTILLLAFNPWLLKKCHWIIMGGDLHDYIRPIKPIDKLKNIFRKFVFRNMGYLVTYIDGDIALARSWCGARGIYIKCLCYLSNTVKETECKNTSHQGDNLVVLVGNSADKNNNHEEIFIKLIPMIDKISSIITPLTYGDDLYRSDVIKNGSRIFGDKFIAITEHLPLHEYKSNVLDRVDVAVFAHNRQQGMGNTISLLARNKAVVMKSHTPQYVLLSNLGLGVISFEDLSLECLEKNLRKGNDSDIVKHIFSVESLKRQWSEML